MSRVMCQVSHGKYEVWIIFFFLQSDGASWGEGLLSMGPTLSSFKSAAIKSIFKSTSVAGAVQHNAT